MNTPFSLTIAEKYRSPSQKIRIATEDWVKKQSYCPSCGCDISSYENNKPVADFYCLKCKEDYEILAKYFI